MKGAAYHAHPDLRAAAQAAVARARDTRRRQWVSASRSVDSADALRVFGAEESADGERFYWELPSRGEQVAAHGAAAVLELEGPQRFANAARQARRLRDDLHVAAPTAEAGRAPLLVGAFGFGDAPGRGDWEGFPAGRLVLPSRVFHRYGDCTSLTIHREVTAECDPAGVAAEMRAGLVRTAPPTVSGKTRPDAEIQTFYADADAPHARFRADVAEALRAIAAGSLEKVVLARSVRLQRPGGFDAAEILDTLRRAHPCCASFALARGDSVFLGATPERLLALDGRRIDTAAVAGSAPRGRSPEEDARHARELCESKKEQAEHAVVVRALQEALEPVCSRLDLAEAPRLLQLEGIQHLETPLAGVLREEASLLELAGRLHPTPAVGGAPREAALAWIAEHEDLERGWYAGPVGLVRRDGGGELWVALRAALLRGTTARLFAGSGIVAGAVPEAELRETQLKLRTMLDALVDL